LAIAGQLLLPFVASGEVQVMAQNPLRRMMAFFALTAVATVLCLSTPSETTGQDKDTGKAAAGEPKVVFFDDFSGPELDRKMWNVEVTGRTVNNEQQAYIDSKETIYLVKGPEAEGAGNGALVIQARYQQGFTTPQGKKFDFVSGRLNTQKKVQVTHGTLSAKMKLPAGAGLWPAFWALGNGAWPAGGEIDVMENVGDPTWTSVALHGPGYSGDKCFVQKHTLPEGKDSTAWHIYSVDWLKDEFVFKVDDRLVYSVTRKMIEQKGKYAYENPEFLVLNLALGGGYPASVNKVTAPYRGLPASTVEMIKAGKAKVLVDWVKITQR
jgi:beta-glucanase (GH16 family)